MTPKQQGTLEGQQVFFYNLYEKRMEKVDLEEGELDGSDTPSEKEIDILTGQVKHEPVVQSNIDSKQKEEDFMQKLNGDEDIAINNFYDANETLVDHKKKKMQSLRKETKN